MLGFSIASILHGLCVRNLLDSFEPFLSAHLHGEFTRSSDTLLEYSSPESFVLTAIEGLSNVRKHQFKWRIIGLPRRAISAGHSGQRIWSIFRQNLETTHVPSHLQANLYHAIFIKCDKTHRSIKNWSDISFDVGNLHIDISRWIAQLEHTLWSWHGGSKPTC